MGCNSDKEFNQCWDNMVQYITLKRKKSSTNDLIDYTRYNTSDI